MRRYLLSLVSERPQPTGIGTYALEVARAIGPLLGADERLVVVRHRDAPACAREAVEEVALAFPAGRTAWRRVAEQTLLPLVAARARATLVHAFNYALPAAWTGPTVLTLHDDRALRERAAGGRLNRLIAAGLRRSVRRATRLTANSSHTAARCAATFGLDAARIVIAPPGVDHAAFAAVDDARRAAVRARLGLGDRPVALFVGEVEPHKNVPRLIDAFAAVAARDPAPLLVVAGGRGADLPVAQARAAPLGERVRWPGYLPRADLVSLIAAASVVALPSLDEGFGMPVLEGFAAGVPVLTSTAGALPETAGDAALLVDPADGDAIAAGLERLLRDHGLRAALIDRGRARAAEYTWSRAAAAVLDLYRQVASGVPVAPRERRR
ncbi:MAG: glycosyltransferase family 4 protein [Planctomycetes bacterium]|nr:glycosyltransferase family 4 protein [Planctomycetota bacterium]